MVSLGALPALHIDNQLLSSPAPLTMYRQGAQDRLDANQRDLMQAVGQTAAGGNYLEAARQAMAGGDMKTGMDLSSWDMDRRTKAVNFLNDGVERADTPEKWNALVGMVGKAFGEDAIGEYRDFNNRPAVMTALQKATLDLQRQDNERAWANFNKPTIGHDDDIGVYAYTPTYDRATQSWKTPDQSSLSVVLPANKPKGELKEVNGRIIRVMPDDTTKDVYAPTVTTTDPSSLGPYKDFKQKADVEGDLRKELTKVNQDYATIRDSAAKIETIVADPNIGTGASDISLVYSYMKILDPGSVVRESEYATAQNAASVPDRIRNLYNKMLEGEFLSPQQRQNFIDEARKLNDTQTKQYVRSMGQYRGVAERIGVDPRNIVLDSDIVIDPATGEITRPSFRPRTEVPAGQGQIPPAAIQFLRENPSAAAEFEKKYGVKADQFLRGR